MRNEINHDMTDTSRVSRIAVAATAILMCFVTTKSVIAENLLRNSSFQLATNRTTPDYWDLHHVAAFQFRDLYTQYNLVDTPQPPVPGVRVLKITNSDSGFPYLYLLSDRLETTAAAGSYVFSVYVRADRPRSVVQLAPAWELVDQRISKAVTTEWQRYSIEFRIDTSGTTWLSPLLALPSRGTYWISAPQLEPGSRLTPYAPAAEDARLGERTAEQRSSAAAAVAALASATSFMPATDVSARFEFSSYTDEPLARLKVSYTRGSTFDGVVACSANSSQSGKAAPVWSSPVALKRGQTDLVDVPLRDFTPGDYFCSVTGAGRSASAKLSVLSPNPLIVRTNQFRNTLEVNKSGYDIRGLQVGGFIPAEWYVSDAVEHGINTIFIDPPRLEANGRLRLEDFDAVLRLAGKYGLKVIVGPAVAGQKSDAWKSALSRYSDLIRRYRDNAAIIGWFVVDEPQAPTLHKNELAGIYDMVKAIDPYRLVFNNWGSDDVPASVGVEPHGSLAATDIYSIDYYPFSNSKTSLEIYALRTIRMLRTGMLSGRPGHSWLQLYGSLDVIREPTGDELNYMAYINLLYGGNYSYWQTKSNAKPTWDRVRKINEEIQVLMNLLMLNSQASELQAPTLMGHFLYSAWKAAGTSYLLVVHVGDRTEPLTMALEPIFGTKVSAATDYFGRVSADISRSTLKDSFSAYATRVYKIN